MQSNMLSRSLSNTIDCEPAETSLLPSLSKRSQYSSEVLKGLTSVLVEKLGMMYACQVMQHRRHMWHTRARASHIVLRVQAQRLVACLVMYA